MHMFHVSFSVFGICYQLNGSNGMLPFLYMPENIYISLSSQFKLSFVFFLISDTNV